MLKGSCLCGGIRHEIDAELVAVTNCHCGLFVKRQPASRCADPSGCYT